MTTQWCKNKGLAAFALVVLSILAALGNWQLQRADEKRALLAQQEQRQQQAPLNLSDVAVAEDVAYLPVKLRGKYDQQHQFLIDNKVLHSQVGYEVLTPFETTKGDWVMVSRGWIQAGRTRQDLPNIVAIETGDQTVVEIVVDVYAPQKTASWLSPPPENLSTNSWPLVIQSFDHAVLGEMLGEKIYAHQVRLREYQLGALPRDWQIVNVKPEKHTGYAVKWFAMAFALIIWYLFANTNLKQMYFKKS
jgi:surfeit locus 1 family protein